MGKGVSWWIDKYNKILNKYIYLINIEGCSNHIQEPEKSWYILIDGG